MSDTTHDRIAVVDFGGQYAHLLASRIRRLGCYSEILPADVSPDAARSYAGLVYSGGPASVYDADSVQSDPALLGLGIPVLGICYGHQLLAHALGGRVARNPRGREIGSVEVEALPAARDDALLGALPVRLTVQATHVESVLELPPGARLLAVSRGDPHHAFSAGARAWGVQFHPEFDAEVIRGYLEARREILGREGLDAAALLAGVRESEDGRALLRRFAELVSR